MDNAEAMMRIKRILLIKMLLKKPFYDFFDVFSFLFFLLCVVVVAYCVFFFLCRLVIILTNLFRNKYIKIIPQRTKNRFIINVIVVVAKVAAAKNLFLIGNLLKYFLLLQVFLV